LKDNLNLMGKVEIRQSANRIVVKAKEEILLVGGGSYIRINGSTIESGTAGDWVARAGRHQFKPPATLGAGLPGLPKVGEGELALEQMYKTNKEGFQNAPYRVVDCLGHEKRGTLDAIGKAWVAGLAKGPVKVFFGEDPRNPWDDGHYFGNFDWWPDWARRRGEGAEGRSVLARASASCDHEVLKQGGEEIKRVLAALQARPDLANDLLRKAGDPGEGLSGIAEGLLPGALPGGAQGLFGEVLAGGMGNLEALGGRLGRELMNILPSSVMGAWEDAGEFARLVSRARGVSPGGLGQALPLPSARPTVGVMVF
jgi:type VI secretion system secreted protein VgrG